MNLYFRLLMLYLGQWRRSKLGVWSTGTKTFRVMPNDLDLLGHMNNGRYLTLCDLGRMDLMMRSGYWKRLTAAGWYPVVAGQMVSYRRSLNPFQKFQLTSRMLGFDEHGVYIEHTFRTREHVCAQVHLRARFLKKTGGKVSDDELRAFLGSDLAAMPEVPEWLSEWAASTRSLR
ncbi:thioesterase family protein [Leucobacter sp. UCMA 4100]|uniref:thioesterase family protein n=1 Tax=Leucobacter sp. UCMA 4100 TaxID=2810534 RepID=UPI0022EA1513|nr:thioesterase family protein [Leucobacter sp. UCMA 4100]MDA3148059.1 thioesterase family protein [Leucobacter sp. UCMA 4100]